MFRSSLFGLAALALVAATPAAAITTSLGQTWDFEPDAWARGTTADSAYFGWDTLEGSGVFLSAGQILDDTTPDLGTSASSRLFQGTDGLADPTPTIYGHRSGSGNYYSGFISGANVDDTISGVAPASGAGGFTTVLVQALGQPGNSVTGITFDAGAGWTQTANLYGQYPDGTGAYWQEWTAPGANVAFAVNFDSPAGTSSLALDAFQIDTFWSATGPVTNTVTVVPEPGTALLLGLGLASLAGARRR
ncbi:MAG: PEP-CTERM sorting domain-containing protein [Myxococcota bacterium]